jgi:hypothetical protein
MEFAENVAIGSVFNSDDENVIKMLKENNLKIGQEYPIFIGCKLPEKYSYANCNGKFIYPEPKPFNIEIISNDYFLKDKFIKIQNMLKLPPDPVPAEFNPELKIEKFNDFNVIRDDILPGGTKTRGAYNLIKNLKEKNIYYAGPSQGVAQVALGVLCKEFGKNAFMVYSSNYTEMSARAEKYGVKLIKSGRNLVKTQELAKKIVEAKKNSFLLPFGLDSIEFNYYLICALKSVVKIEPKRLWLVAGSATLLHCLYFVFPTTYFMVVSVGKKIYWDNIDPSRTRIFKSSYEFSEPTTLLPPYNSVSTYDAKIWEFVLKHGGKNDYIWNVAG